MDSSRPTIVAVTEIPEADWGTWKIEAGPGWVTILMLRQTVADGPTTTRFFWKLGLGEIALRNLPEDFRPPATVKQMFLQLTEPRGIPHDWLRAAR
jgi:hypothetical protein